MDRMRKAAAREQGLRMAMESYGSADLPPTTAALLQRATEFENYLYPPAEQPRPHHACSMPECATPSGKTACHTCAEPWPCSTELRKRGGVQ